jgi:mono/diheme cytochrome c family protein
MILRSMTSVAFVLLAASALWAESCRPVVSSHSFGTHTSTVLSPAVAVEVLVPAVAISFQYVNPPGLSPLPTTPAGNPSSVGGPSGAPNLPVARYAARPYFATNPPAAAVAQAVPAAFQNRCASCHGGGKAKGGVSLFNGLGQFTPTRAGSPLSPAEIYDATIVRATMPVGGTLSASEKNEITNWFRTAK